MVADLLYFLPPFISFAMLFIGFSYQQYVFGVMGGFSLFLFGLAIIISPISSIPSFLNLITGCFSFGLGAYVTIAASIEEIEKE